MNFEILIVSIGTFLFSLGLTRISIRLLSDSGFIDVPNHRSSHNKPIPRGGGLSVLISFLMAVLFLHFLGVLSLYSYIWFYSGLLLLSVVNVFDDKYNLPAYGRLLVQIIAAVIICLDTGGITELPLPEPLNVQTGIFAYPLTVIWIVAMINIYNFLDGIDGIAGMQGILATTGICALQFPLSDSALFMVLGMAVLGFLIFNWHPAKLFMGDVGSTGLGFTFASLPLYLEGISSGLAVYMTIQFLWFFIADGATVIIYRLWKGEKIWTAHKNHIYQKMVQNGLKHNQVVWIFGAFTLIQSGVSLILYLYFPEYLGVAIPLGIVLFLAYRWIEINTRNG